MTDFDARARDTAICFGACLDHCLPGTKCACVDAIAAALKAAYNLGVDDVSTELVRWWSEDYEQIERIARSKKMPT